MNALLGRRSRGGWLALVSALALAACGHHAAGPGKIVGFGPSPVDHGKPFNVQANGDSAIWVRIDQPANAKEVLVLDGQRLKTQASGNLLTAAVPLSIIATPGPKALVVELDSKTSQVQSQAVSFMVD